MSSDSNQASDSSLKKEINLYELSEVTMKPHSFKNNPNRKPFPRRYKPYRQLVTDEMKYLQSKPNIKYDTPTYTSIGAPPSLKPQKHYCDITGLPGKYKSPSNSLRFNDAEIYQEVIKNMPPSMDQEYLGLRGANIILK
ncbi:Piso0_000652 [Millerozyma farinosa CBS 7064]|uniref:Piso0_000652 protein n=1 Tax=Pichia sorbitophila (strain ATCC MYA-4447 / BCRC 22081 / CBS 7064 / NBRC 10061 / NRRL Y-12695) TaxID=559304 RepID=G8YR52_PICSO|nr:Piso0_000652 [Millerozyma farinosa CBS 7064]